MLSLLRAVITQRAVGGVRHRRALTAARRRRADFLCAKLIYKS
jgi:hypothetical protein